MPTVTSKMVTSVQMSALQKSGIKFFVMGLANYGKGLRFCLFGGARTRGGAPLILVFFFSWLGDMVSSLIQYGGRNKGEIFLHAIKSLLGLNYLDSRFHCLRPTEEAQRISGSNPPFTDEEAVAQRGGWHVHKATLTSLRLAVWGPVSRVHSGLKEAGD